MAAPARKRVRRRPEQRRAQIVEEAIRLIGERGYFSFTVEALARRCQLTAAGLLHHFGTKEKLLMKVLEDRDRRELETVIALAGLTIHDAGRVASLREVHDLLHAIVVSEYRQAELVRFYAVLRAEAMNDAHPAHAYFRIRDRRTLKDCATMLAPYSPQPETAAREVLALMQGLAQQWVFAERSFDIVAAWDHALAKLLPLP